MSQMRTDIVLVKLGAAIIVVTALGNFQHYVRLILGQPWWIPTAILAFLFAVLLPVLIAIAFWRFPNSVVGSLYSKELDSEAGSVDADRFYIVGITLIGVYTLVFGIIELVHVETLQYFLIRHIRELGYPDTTRTPEVDARRIANIVRIAIGILLIVGRKGLSRFLRGLRTGGSPSP